MYRVYYKADADKTKELIDAFVNMKHGDLVTSDPDKKSQFKLVPPVLGDQVTFYDEQMNKIADLVVGDLGPDYRSNYVLKPGSNDIYEVSENLKNLFETQLAAVRSKAIFSAAPETFTSVTIKDAKMNTGVALNRVEGAWQGTGPGGAGLQLSTAQVDTFLSSLGSVNANSFVDKIAPSMRPEEQPAKPTNPDDPYGFKNPTLEIDFTTSDNVNHTLIIGNADGTTSYAMADGRTDDVFKISNTTLTSIRPTPDQLEGKPSATQASPIATQGAPLPPSSQGVAVPSSPPIPAPPPPGSGG